MSLLKSVELTIDSITFSLRAHHDFTWLHRIGTVVDVFDQQDSGNICFGVEDGNSKRFVKYAGAQPINYKGKPASAIHRLKRAIPIYRDLRHESLINLIDWFPTDNGFVALFDWFEGENLHPHWKFPPPSKYTDPASPFYRFKNLSIRRRLAALDEVLRFHLHVEQKGYVAIDLYDGSLMYDFEKNVLKICDIDFYARKPYRNHRGRLWGSSRFMSPEEYELNAAIDARTNVYTMGAVAFCMLGSDTDRSLDKWEASPEQYRIALKATSPERELRYATVEEFYRAWTGGLGM